MFLYCATVDILQGWSLCFIDFAAWQDYGTYFSHGILPNVFGYPSSSFSGENFQINSCLISLILNYYMCVASSNSILLQFSYHECWLSVVKIQVTFCLCPQSPVFKEHGITRNRVVLSASSAAIATTTNILLGFCCLLDNSD